MTNLIRVEGIGETYAAKLAGVGITTVEGFLTAAATPKGREKLAEDSGISHHLILEWANHADLFRIKGVAEQYADLLEEAGVDTIPELAQRNADHLHSALVETNRAKKLVRRLPSRDQVADWVAQAKALPRSLTY